MNSQVSEKKRVFVGVSGGVDSSVTLALLKQQGYHVTGVFLKVWSPEWLPCTWRDERRSAMRVCATLGVPFMTLDCEKEYKEKIVDYMIAEYAAGRTPNPDVFCNKEIKFGVFLDKARALGADFVATGHYVQRDTNPRMHSNDTNGYELKEAADKEKDQSYFLSQLNQEQIFHALFPIGHLQKIEVRELARKFGLPTAEKKDSQGLCFIGKVDMKDFLSHYITAAPGDVLDESGQIIGRHEGAMFYTIGERHGFEIFKKTDHAVRLFVITKDMGKNTITVGEKIKRADQEKIRIKNMNWISGIDPNLSKEYGVRFRYRQEKQKTKIVKTPDGYEIIPNTPQLVAPGQLAAIYDGEVCLGSGVLC